MKLVFLMAVGTVGALMPTAFGQTIGGGGSLNCGVNVTGTPTLRGEGFTENTGDITLTCTGGSTASVGDTIPQVNITIFLNTQVTSRLLGSNNQSEALLLIDEPGSTTLGGATGPGLPFGPLAPQSVCPTYSTGCPEVVSSVPSAGVPAGCAAGTPGCIIPAGTPINVPTNSAQGTTATTNGYNVFQGVANVNSITWFGVPVLAPGAAGFTHTFRFTNIRVNAVTLSGGPGAGATPVVGAIAVSNTATLPISNPTPTVGFVQSGLTTAAMPAPTLSQCTSQTKAAVNVLSFSELFGTAFKTRVVPAADTLNAGQASSLNQNVPGTIYNSESNLTLGGLGGQNGGLTDFGTRLKATFNNVPAGVRLFVSVSNVTNAVGPVTPPAVIGGTANTSFAQLTSSETGAYSAVPSIDTAAGNVPITEILVILGSASAVWEVVNTNPNAAETFRFAVFATYTSDPTHNSPPAGTATVNLSMAPTPPAFYASSGAYASSTLDIPRFMQDPNAAQNLFAVDYSTCAPALSISSAHTGSFTQGQAGASYTVTVSNATGAGPTSGTVTVTETMPAGLVLMSMAGTGWTCPGTASNNCTRSDALATGASYPAITTIVNVATNAASPQVNAVAVSGGGSAAANATDSTVIAAPALSISKMADAATAGPGAAIGYTVAVSNSSAAGTAASAVLNDPLPAGTGIGWSISPSYSGPGTCFVTGAAGSQTLSCSFGDLAAGATASVHVASSTSASSCGVYSNTATAFASNSGVMQSNTATTTVCPTALRFVPITACRVVDTRHTNDPFGGPTIAGGGSRDFALPSGACNIPPTAQAYSVNVTAVPPGALGFLTIWPTGQTRPVASTLNSVDGRVKANAAIVPAGSGGAVSVYASNTTDVVLDINGYFVPATDSTALAFYPLVPCRVADTRKPSFGVLGSPSLVGGQGRTFPVQSSSCNIPPTAQAYSLNFAAVPPGALGFLTVFPTGQARPTVSTLNDLTGTVVANAAIVPAGTSGSIDVYASNNTDVVIDVNGYFAPPVTGGLSLYAVTPCRVLNTRQPAGSQPITGQDVNVSASTCGIPGTAQAYVFNVTAVPPSALGFLTLWPQGQTRPTVSTLNAIDAAVTSNMAIVPAANGSISAFGSNPTHVVMDISGYFGQ